MKTIGVLELCLSISWEKTKNKKQNSVCVPMFAISDKGEKAYCKTVFWQSNKNLSSTSVRHNLQIWFGIYKEACLQEYNFSVFNFLLNSIYLLDYKAKTLG